MVVSVKYVVFADYNKYVENNINQVITRIEAKLDEVKVIAEKIKFARRNNCEDILLPMHKIIALNPTITSISIIRDGDYYCSSIVGLNISEKALPEKEIYIKEKDALTGVPSISYYHRYDDNNGIQFFMKNIRTELKENRIGNMYLSNQQYTISKDNQFATHIEKHENSYSSANYDFVILLEQNMLFSIKNYLVDNRFIIIIVLLMIALSKALSVKAKLLDMDFFRLRKAIKNNQIKPFIQPIVNADEDIVGGEVLARWITKNGKIISPLEFIPKIEKFNFMLMMTRSLLMQLKQSFQNSNKSNLRISVNLTEICLYDEAIYDLCRELSEKCLLVLEFTETTEFENRHKIIAYMQKFRDVGVKFALDDYGTGYSSLQYLNYYHFDFLKIDKSFIDDIETNQQTLRILENIILLANNLNIDLVAEGVENKCQKKILHDLKISSHQGFLYFKPMSLNEFNDKVTAGNIPRNIES